MIFSILFSSEVHQEKIPLIVKLKLVVVVVVLLVRFYLAFGLILLKSLIHFQEKVVNLRVLYS